MHVDDDLDIDGDHKTGVSMIPSYIGKEFQVHRILPYMCRGSKQHFADVILILIIFGIVIAIVIVILIVDDAADVVQIGIS